MKTNNLGTACLVVIVLLGVVSWLFSVLLGGAD